MKRVHHLFVPSLTGCLLVASLLSSCTSVHGQESISSTADSQLDTFDTPPPTKVQTGMASWYGRPFHGRRTANGEVYNMYQATAAHLTAPLGTYARVTNLHTGRSVHVRINDRGPHIRNRILDLSYGAARQLDIVRAGSARVKVEFLGSQAAALHMASLEALPTSDSEQVAERVEDHPHTMPILPAVSVTPEATQGLYRVRLSPLQHRDAAERVVHQGGARNDAAVLVAMVP